MRLLFTPQAREAVEKVKVIPYVERVAASDNLRIRPGRRSQQSQPPFWARKDEAEAGRPLDAIATAPA